MSILDLFKVDLNTPQPGGRQGESPRSAFTKYNDALDAIAQLVNITSVTEPSPTVPLMTWLDTSVTPPTIRRRNASNNGWVVIGPALDFVYSRSNILGTVSQSGGVPTGSIIERGSNANGEYVKFADGTMICREGSFLMDTVFDPAILGGVWNFPAAFIAAPAVNFSPLQGIQADVAGVPLRNRFNPAIASRSATTASVRVFSGTGSFVEGDVIRTDITAIGRWF